MAPSKPFRRLGTIGEDARRAGKTETKLDWAVFGLPSAQGAKLKPIVWSEVGLQVYVPQWTRLVQFNIPGLKGVTPESLGQLATDLKTFGKTLVDFSKEKPEEEQAESLANFVIGAGLTLLLMQRGGQLDTTPGNDILVKIGGQEAKPFGLMLALKNKEVTAEAWVAQCTQLNITGVDLGVVVAPAAEDKDQEPET